MTGRAARGRAGPLRLGGGGVAVVGAGVAVGGVVTMRRWRGRGGAADMTDDGAGLAAIRASIHASISDSTKPMAFPVMKTACGNRPAFIKS